MNTKCGSCENKAFKEYNTDSLSYYSRLNEDYSIKYFCSEKCKDEYIKQRKCFTCKEQQAVKEIYSGSFLDLTGIYFFCSEDCKMIFKSNNKCHSCDNLADDRLMAQTQTYYRCKASANHFFCSKNCKTKFTETKMCQYCAYYDDLVFGEDGKAYCTSSEYWDPTCYQKYLGKKDKITRHAFLERINELICDDEITEDDIDAIQKYINECHEHI